MNSHALPVTHLREVTNVIPCNRRAAGESASISDESRFLGRRLCKIAHIRRALQKPLQGGRLAGVLYARILARAPRGSGGVEKRPALVTLGRELFYICIK